MNLPDRRHLLIALATFGSAALAPQAVLAQPAGDIQLLNVSYDVSRELYKDINPAFAAQHKAKTGRTVTVTQSHGGSSRQALSVASGLEADVVTMNQATDLDLLAEKGLIRADWRKAFPNGAAPYTTTTVFLVRKGNPKAIKDWADLTRTGVSVIVPNPKTSGNGRYTYLAAWGSVIAKGGNDAQARDFVAKLLANVPVLDGGGRGATTTFTQRDIGDVLVTFENEAELIENEVGKGKFDVVYPSITIEAEAPVAVVEKVVTKKGTAAAAKAYLDFLYSPEGQQIIAKHNFRPRDAAVAKANAARFPVVKTFTVDSLLGGWTAVTKTHFADGGVYDQLVLKR
ncbi:sulfate ABC transporter substrate-binding protein [Roseateles sp.]|jgi:sulfate transport system substrate-binding protein|uniref:sulfate ABC transporter substrate-binding protein n=1 Tax=Roseateles sp. TaxID=1971397 RepID=UPI0037C50CDF